MSLILSQKNIFSLVLTLFVSFSAIAEYLVPDDSAVLHTIAIGQPQDKMPNQFEMLIWNVHKGEDKEEWAHDLLRFKTFNAILLQESMIDDFMPAVLRQLSPLQTVFATSFEKTDENYQTGVSTSLSAKSDAIFFRRSPVTEPFTDTPKMSLMNVVTLENGNRLLIVNIHGINFVTNSSFRQQINDLLPILQKFQGDVIFAGDFNAWNWGRTAYLSDTLTAMGFTEVEFENDDRIIKFDHAYARGCVAVYAEMFSQIDTSDHDPLAVKWNCQ